MAAPQHGGRAARGPSPCSSLSFVALVSAAVFVGGVVLGVLGRLVADGAPRSSRKRRPSTPRDDRRAYDAQLARQLLPADWLHEPPRRARPRAQQKRSGLQECTGTAAIDDALGWSVLE